MNGTTTSATRAMLRIPPKITSADRMATPTPIWMRSSWKDSFSDSAMALACTALNTSPNTTSRMMENSAPAQGALRPRVM